MKTSLQVNQYISCFFQIFCSYPWIQALKITGPLNNHKHLKTFYSLTFISMSLPLFQWLGYNILKTQIPSATYFLLHLLCCYLGILNNVCNTKSYLWMLNRLVRCKIIPRTITKVAALTIFWRLFLNPRRMVRIGTSLVKGDKLFCFSFLSHLIFQMHSLFTKWKMSVSQNINGA